MIRSAYAECPYNEQLKKQQKKLKRRLIFDRTIIDCFFFIAGVFAAVITLSYYPLPW